MEAVPQVAAVAAATVRLPLAATVVAAGVAEVVAMARQLREAMRRPRELLVALPLVVALATMVEPREVEVGVLAVAMEATKKKIAA